MNRADRPALEITLAVLAAWVVLSAPVVQAQALAELVIIANPEVPADALEKSELERIYLGKTSRWLDGSTVMPAMLKTGKIQEEFVQDYLERPLHRFATYWRQMVFTGKGVPPRTFATEDELAEFVAGTPGALGFVTPGTEAPGVKVLRIDE